MGMFDLSNLFVSDANPTLIHNNSRKKDPTSLDMTDFLQLMIVQLQNQSIDDTMDTTDMLNQMVQMQMITALTNVSDASVMSYASSLVGKEVTIGVYENGMLYEKVVTVTGTGYMNGEQVIFAGDEVYSLSSVMAVGHLPSGGNTGNSGGTNAPNTDPSDELDPDFNVDSGDEDPELPGVEDGDDVEGGNHEVEDGDDTNTDPKVDDAVENPSEVPGDRDSFDAELKDSAGTETNPDETVNPTEGVNS